MASELLFINLFSDSEDYSGDWRWKVTYCLLVYSVTQKITVVTGDCWHRIWPDDMCGFRPEAACRLAVACGHHGPSLDPTPRSRVSRGSDARDRSPIVIRVSNDL